MRVRAKVNGEDEDEDASETDLLDVHCYKLLEEGALARTQEELREPERVVGARHLD